MSGERNLGPASAGPKTGRWVKVVLALSLGINLAIAGLVVGAYMNNHASHPDPEGRTPPEARYLRDLGLGPFLSAFGAEDRQKLAGQMRERVGGIRTNRDTLADELTSILDAVKTVPFDPDVLETAMRRQTSRVVSRAEAGRDVILDTIGEMDDAERATFAQRMERAMQRAMDRSRERARP